MTSTTQAAPSRPRAERAVLLLELLLAVGAYGGAIGLATASVDLGDATARLPFGSLVFAGAALAVVNGVLPSIVLVSAWQRRHWSVPGHLVVGVALMAWIVVQVAVLGPPVHWLQVLYFAWGAAIAGLALRLGALRPLRPPA